VDHFLMLICWALRDRDVRRHFAPLQERCQMMDWGQGRRPASEPPRSRSPETQPALHHPRTCTSCMTPEEHAELRPQSSETAAAQNPSRTRPNWQGFQNTEDSLTIRRLEWCAAQIANQRE
jgi:hypothetical protein